MEAGEKGEIRKNLLKLLRFIPKNRLFFESLTILGVAAVILFVPLSLNDLREIGLDWALAALGGEDDGQLLIAEEPSAIEFQEIERRMLQSESYVYSPVVSGGRQGYQYLIQTDDYYEGLGGEEEFSTSMLVQGNAFLASANPHGYADGIGIFGGSRSDVITYEVKTGDTPSYIAASFGVSTNTLLWANNLDYWSTIRPGQKLVILPVTGILHEVKKGETLVKIVKDYKGDFNETIAYNGLPADGSVSLGQKIIIPGGSKAIYYQPRVYAYKATQVGYIGPYGDKSHKFPWGQCTWDVAQKRYIPWSGNAKSLLANAQKYGFKTGATPQPGAIVATSETVYGHVAYVETVNGNTITISEMSLGRGKLGYRALNINDRRIRGYIY